MATIDLTRGEKLAVSIVIQNDGTNVAASVANGYSIEAWLSNVKGGDELYDLGAVFTNGAGTISYSTANLAAKTYFFDVKLGFPSGEYRWTTPIDVLIVEPITNP